MEMTDVTPETLPAKRAVRRAMLVFLLGVTAGGGGLYLLDRGRSSGGTDDAGFLSALPGILREAHADLEDGDYAFFPNRRSIWVVNRTNGRMANYHFHDDELGSVDRSRVAMLDTNAFPRKDTVIHLSDRNMNNVLWVCNARTGDVQMWTLGRDGALKGETPVACKTDLMDRPTSDASSSKAPGK